MAAPVTVRPGSEPSPRPPSRFSGLITEPRVFLPAAGLLIAFVVVTAAFPKETGDVLATINDTVVEDLGWWYIAAVTGFVFFAAWLAISRLGDIVLGQDDDDPEFSLGSWFAMLFAAGMGIGLVFWGVAEPLSHFASPPPGSPAGTPSLDARTAMDTTYLHWGLHAWAIYVVVGVAIAYSVHRRGNPVSIRWAIEPLLGERVHGFWGDVIDVSAVLGTLFGVATSLGLGVSQISAGLAYLGVVDEPTTLLLIALIVVITSIALVSVVSGVDKGIRILSNVNMGVAVALMLAVVLLGPTFFIFSDFVTQLGSYIQRFFEMSFNARPFQPDGKAWLGDWTTFYWGWWMSWAPFVGVFIARISRGRTVREFVVGVLLVPTLVTFLWFSVMGGTALYEELFGSGGLVGEDGSVTTDTALFQMFDLLPGSAILSGVAVLLIVVFFVTSSDSGSFVVDMLASGGEQNPPVWSRAFWATMEGAVAAVLLYVGIQAQETDPSVNPLGALQTMAILLALPFSLVMVAMCVATARELLAENRVMRREERRIVTEQLTDHITDHVTREMRRRGGNSATPPSSRPSWSSKRSPRGGVSDDR
ncbi:BCCT family transporter [Nocardioides sp. YIM 152588]|uniref:BCCT family transporter n=1 Tax=Nocardioides sp. YIM 152588 TaxID=3158259 RepID=UPI0032E3CCC7